MNILGAAAALAYFGTSILLFVLRLIGRPRAARRLGLIQTVSMGIVAIALLVAAHLLHRPLLYFVQIEVMLLFLLVELLLDFILKLDFRRSRAAVIGYVILFFAGTGGMVGVASRAGTAWAVLAVGLFLIMAVLAFIQHSKVENRNLNAVTGSLQDG